ncbi:sigma-70 family RNA polymerase sigma factor [Desulfopila inferna]|uniref:sigma-70 family RNA polymerase sigma factor n=1 Tax=Desulfopila inferna TaxID=468528 RepID=UPI001F06510C|nr:RNA polymerase factor sigma-32 [Desulfopila inferna]
MAFTKKHSRSIEQFIFPLVSTTRQGTALNSKNQEFNRYLKEIGQYELLSREEMEKMAIRVIEDNDQEAAYRLISANLRLVVKVAMDFQKFWMQNFMDLVQEGNIGLIKAVRKFDPHKGVRFSYYATYWIRAYILKFLMNNRRLVKLGTTQAQRKLFFSLNKEKKALEIKGYVAEPRLLAERLNVKTSDIEEMGCRLDNEEVSLESPIGSDSETEKKDFIASNDPGIEDILCSRDMKKRVHSLVQDLEGSHNEKEKMILEKRLLTDDPLTLQKISEIFGISRERIRQIESNMLRKMKKYIEETDPEMMIFAAGVLPRKKALAEVYSR